jgi:hypothetical protein
MEAASSVGRGGGGVDPDEVEDLLVGDCDVLPGQAMRRAASSQLSSIACW